MVEVDIKKYLFGKLNTYLNKYKKKGIMLGSNDATTKLEELLVQVNKKREEDSKDGYFIPSSDEVSSEETPFDILNKEIITTLLAENKIYLSGNWESFETNVRSKDLTAFSEINLMKLAEKTSSTYLRDLEFPLDTSGNFKQPDKSTTSSGYIAVIGKKALSLIEPPEKIIGPVQYNYLINQPHSQKVLLFGDALGRVNDKGTSLADFFLFMALQKPNTVLDLFVESPFQDNIYDEPVMERFIDEDNKHAVEGTSISDFPNSYLGDLIRAYETSLLQNKSYSVEPMRVHYTDLRLRNIELVDTFTVPLMMYLEDIIAGKIEVVNIWETEWLREDEYEEEYLSNLSNYKVTKQKIALLPKELITTFSTGVVVPIGLHLGNFYTEEASKFEKMKDNVNIAVQNNSAIKKADISTAKRLLGRLKVMQYCLGAAYMTLRIIKPANNRYIPLEEKRDIYLKKGETMSSIMAYLSQPQLLYLQESLERVGFTCIKSGDSPEHVISYQEIKPTLDLFLS